MIIGKKTFDLSKTHIVGIINVTPDSFFDGGFFQCQDEILRRAEQMIAEGCAIIDIGGESTRPGFIKVSEAEEIARVTSVIESLSRHFDVPVSLDSYKAGVAKAGIEAGAAMINDIWGLRYDAAMAAVIAKTGVACCLMDNRRDLKKRCDLVGSEDKITSVTSSFPPDFSLSLDLAHTAGIKKDRIILDPGIGFDDCEERHQKDLIILSRLQEYRRFGYPCLLGASRKSVIGHVLDLAVTERLEGTIITTVMAIMAGFSFVRVHDIEANRRAIKMTEEILTYRENET
ncbi:MAG: dihydropteroate synthase [Lachnospiraceae bacterium]|jgi:dihydropteroate synthase|nr:dihydropteroate synthase [Lachnospiraceae bacterium]